MTTTTIDIGVFAHEEAMNIGAILADLARQNMLVTEGVDARVLVLANGCSDATVPRARDAIASLDPALARRFLVVDLAEGGKSRTWNRFVHDLSRPEAGLFGFVDADITLPRSDTLARLAAAVACRPELRVAVSSPVKDATLPGSQASPLARLIARSPSADSERTAICGQLYVMDAATARGIAMPIGLPVEDGFLRAMVLTDLLTRPEAPDRIDRDPKVFHIFQSIRAPGALVRHQQRIVVGSAINAALFGLLRRETQGNEVAARRLLFEVAQDEDWLARALRVELPRLPHGWVPFHFLTKRVGQFVRRAERSPKAFAMLMLGLCLDLLAWTGATWRMMRGRGAGHW